MANDGAAHEPPPGPIGRVRLDEAGIGEYSESAATAPTEGSTGAVINAAMPEGNGWSIAGVGLALLLVAIMIGALVIILSAVFQVKL